LEKKLKIANRNYATVLMICKAAIGKRPLSSRCLGWRVPMLNILLALTLLLALGAAVELSVMMIFVKLLPLLLRLH
jgi:hypothetical protein